MIYRLERKSRQEQQVSVCVRAWDTWNLETPERDREGRMNL